MTVPAPNPRPLLDLGLVVFPLPADSKAAAPGWQHTQIRPGEPLDAWPDGANIGVGARANNLLILDLDRIDDEPIGLLSLISRAYSAGSVETGPAPIPDTLTVDTPRRGEHRYFRLPQLPPGVTIGSTSAGTSGLGPGIDTRGPGRTRGGYVVGPGSVFNGQPYAIRDPDVPIAELPVWIASWLLDAAALRAERAAREDPGRSVARASYR